MTGFPIFWQTSPTLIQKEDFSVSILEKGGNAEVMKVKYFLTIVNKTFWESGKYLINCRGCSDDQNTVRILDVVFQCICTVLATEWYTAIAGHPNGPLANNVAYTIGAD